MITIIHGKNSFASKQLKDKIIQSYLDETGSELGLEQFDGANLEPSRLEEIVTTLPFLTTNRMVVINHASQQIELTDQILKLAESIPDSTHLLIYEHGLDNRSRFAKALMTTKHAEVYQQDQLDEYQTLDWVKKTVGNLKATIDNRLAKLLIDRVGLDQWRLYNEIKKLASYNSQISEQSILELTDPSVEENVFRLTDAITQHDLGKVLTIYQELRSLRLEPIYLFTMIVWQLHNLLIVKTAGGISPSQIASDHKLSPFVIRKCQNIVGRFSLDQIRRAMAQTVTADITLKSRSLDSDLVLEKLIIDLHTTLNGD